MANLMRSPKLAIIGSGKIASFHADAFINVGFEITHVSSSKNSKSIAKFGDIYNVKNVYQCSFDLLKAQDQWDCILLLIPTEKNIEYITKILEINKPCLIEKPVSKDLNFLSQFSKNEFPRIRVGYNRRFYATIQMAKDFIKKEGPVYLKMELPESVNPKGNYENVLINSCHGVDLLFYLFGEISLEKNNHFASDRGRLVTLKSKREDLISLLMNWNSPSNFKIEIFGNKRRLELKPFENAEVFEDMEIIQPTTDLPIRRYLPKKVSSSSSFPDRDNQLKPGFFEQAKEMMDILNGKCPEHSASLYDAFKVQKIIERILSK